MHVDQRTGPRLDGDQPVAEEEVPQPHRLRQGLRDQLGLGRGEERADLGQCPVHVDPVGQQHRCELGGGDLYGRAHLPEMLEVVGRDGSVPLAGEIDHLDVGVTVRMHTLDQSEVTDGVLLGDVGEIATVRGRTHREVDAESARGVHDGLGIAERDLARIGHHLHRPPVNDVLVPLDVRRPAGLDGHGLGDHGLREGARHDVNATTDMERPALGLRERDQ